VSSKPTVEDFIKTQIEQWVKGIFFFNSDLWHAAGINTTDVEESHHNTFTKPFYETTT
jgi:ectoine hydroxylase-related dioxygenase (phytanoyl-CoA dioxygenase family)